MGAYALLGVTAPAGGPLDVIAVLVVGSICGAIAIVVLGLARMVD